MSSYDENRKILHSLVDSSKLSHAYIFEGDNIENLKNFACDLSSKILDSSNLEQTVDFVLVDKEYMKVDNVRQIIQDSKIAPFKSRKIYLFVDASNMNEQSQSALLKTLEEPSKYAIFIFLITNSTLLLETVRSRCVTYYFEEKEEKSYTDDIKKRTEKIFVALVEKNAIDMLKLMEELKGIKQDFLQQTNDIMEYIEELLLIKNGVLKDEDKIKMSISRSITTQFLLDAIDIVIKMQTRYKANCYYNSICDMLLMRFMEANY